MVQWIVWKWTRSVDLKREAHLKPDVNEFYFSSSSSMDWLTIWDFLGSNTKNVGLRFIIIKMKFFPFCHINLPSLIFCSNSSNVGSIRSHPSGGGFRLLRTFGIFFSFRFTKWKKICFVLRLHDWSDWHRESAMTFDVSVLNYMQKRVRSMCILLTDVQQRHLSSKWIMRADVFLHFPSNFPIQSASRDINSIRLTSVCVLLVKTKLNVIVKLSTAFFLF